MTKSRHINRPRKLWTPHELRILKSEYAHVPTVHIARRLGRHISGVYQRAQLMGLKKSAEFMAGPYSGTIRKGHAERGAPFRFKKGNVPANKGLRRPGWFSGRMRETQFRKGQRSGVAARQWVPIGSLRVNSDGYLDRKVRDKGPPQRRWESVHRLVWKAAHGRIPRNCVVAFRPGCRTTEFEKITGSALELITRKELARRNRMWTRYPKDIARLMQLRGALNRQIRQRERESCHQK